MREEGVRLRSRNIELRYASSPVGIARVAVVVPRYRNIVIKRNRVKRILREHIRTSLLPTLKPVDLVIKALPGAYGTRAESLRSELSGMVSELLTGRDG